MPCASDDILYFSLLASRIFPGVYPCLSEACILLPVAQSVGLHPVQFGIMMVLNCGIGLLTPPVGSVLFIGSAVAKRPMEKVVRATLPFYLCMVLALLLVSFIPSISLWLPRITGAL
jgi:TRAP-type C4-dicarboxylate transport system permease large subunit